MSDQSILTISVLKLGKKGKQRMRNGISETFSENYFFLLFLTENQPTIYIKKNLAWITLHDETVC